MMGITWQWRSVPSEGEKGGAERRRDEEEGGASSMDNAPHLTFGHVSQTRCWAIWNRPGLSCTVFISLRQLHSRVPDVCCATLLLRSVSKKCPL